MDLVTPSLRSSALHDVIHPHTGSDRYSIIRLA